MGSTPIFGSVIIETKYKKLVSLLQNLKKAVLAYSGGVDSSFLLKVLIDSIGSKNTIACMCCSPLISRDKIASAESLAEKLGSKLIVCEMPILSNTDFLSNTPARCYICKKQMYQIISEKARLYNIDNIVSGTNYDDLTDFRPGNIAACQAGVLNPLAEAELTKEDIRILSRKLNLETANTPSSPCSASRIPYGQKITIEKLQQIQQGEVFLHNLGFDIVRVRHFGQLAKIEVPKKQISMLIKKDISEKIIDKFRQIGFNSVSIDIQGFRPGALNEAIRLNR